MAFTLKRELTGALFSRTEAEDAFFTWWDKTKQYVTNGLLLLGIVAYPTTMFQRSPLWCNPCMNETKNCEFMKVREDFSYASRDTLPGYNSAWVTKYCTMKEVDDFTLYFPYIILMFSLLMVVVERGFNRISQTGRKLESFYYLVVKDVLSANEQPEKGERCPVVIKKRKDIAELSQRYKQRSSFYAGYLLKTMFGILLGTGFLGYCCLRGLPIAIKICVIDHGMFGCNVYGTSYECAGAPTRFYLALLTIAIICIATYTFCCVYTLLWLHIPSLNKLWAFLNSYNDSENVATIYCKDIPTVSKDFFKEVVGNNGNEEFESQTEAAEEAWARLQNYYYDEKDLRILLNLVAETNGVTASLHVLTLFDPKIHYLFEPREVRVKIMKSEKRNQNNQTQGQEEEENGLKDYDVTVNFKQPIAVNGILNRMKRYVNSDSIVYQVQVFPSIPSLQKSKKLWKYKKDIQGGIEETVSIPITTKKVSLTTLDIVTNSFEELKMKIENKELDGNAKTRTIRVNTIVGGKTLSYQTVWIGPIKRKATTNDQEQNQPTFRNDADAMNLNANFLTELKRKTMKT